MAATMDKKNVKLAFKDPKAVKWNRVQECSGAAIPSVAKQALVDAMANPKNKKLAVKVGLIKTDLYLRIKNGSTHVQDVRLVRNWTPPSGWVQEDVGDVEDETEEEEEGGAPVTPTKDPVYLKKVADWKKGKEDAKALGQRVNEAIKRIVTETEGLAERAETEASRVMSGSDTGGTALGTATNSLNRIQQSVQAADQQYQQYFVVYDRHRSGEKGEDIDKEDREGYGMPFFMQTLKPLDQDANALKRSINLFLEKAQTAVQQITAYQQNGPDQAYLLKAQSLVRQAATLLNASKNVLGGQTGDIEKMVTRGSGIYMDLESVIKEKDHELKLANADKALQRLTNIRQSVPRMAEYLKELKILISDAGKIPKEKAKVPTIKTEIETLASTYKEATAYHTTWHKHAATAEKAYAEILKKVNA